MQRAEWLAKLDEAGVRFRAATLYAELDVLRTLRPPAKAALIAEAQRDPAWGVLDDPVPRAGAGGAAAGDPADALAVPQQIFEVDALTCPSYHGVMRIVAFITQPSVIDQILTHRRPRG